MFWGFVLTAGAVAVLVIWGLVEIFRVDRIIEKVDRELAENESAERK